MPSKPSSELLIVNIGARAYALATRRLPSNTIILAQISSSIWSHLSSTSWICSYKEKITHIFNNFFFGWINLCLITINIKENQITVYKMPLFYYNKMKFMWRWITHIKMNKSENELNYNQCAPSQEKWKWEIKKKHKKYCLLSAKHYVIDLVTHSQIWECNFNKIPCSERDKNVEKKFVFFLHLFYFNIVCVVWYLTIEELYYYTFIFRQSKWKKKKKMIFFSF